MSAVAADWFGESEESIRARLAGAVQIQARIRFTVVAMAVISMMMFIAAYNAYLSYDSNWVDSRRSQQFASQKTTPDILTEQGLRNWVDSRNVLISLLGIRVTVDDAPVLGTSALWLLSIWLVLLTREENHSIGTLLRATDTVPAATEYTELKRLRERQWWILHSIESNSTFINLDDSLTRINALDPVESSNHVAGAIKHVLSRTFLAVASAFFFYFPMVVSFFVFALDRLSYVDESPFASEDRMPGLQDTFFWPSFWVFLVVWAMLCLCCWLAHRYTRSTESVIRQYAARVRAR